MGGGIFLGDVSKCLEEFHFGGNFTCKKFTNLCQNNSPKTDTESQAHTNANLADRDIRSGSVDLEQGVDS